MQKPAFFNLHCKRCFQERHIVSKGYPTKELFFKKRFAIIMKCSNCGFEWGIDSGDLTERR